MLQEVQTTTAPRAEVTSWPLTEAQEGLWYAQRLDPDNPSFNCGHALWISGPLNEVAFKQACTQAARECESLALRMTETAEGVRQ